ncbi:MAG TPA: Gfo/Idh/MocA family oxidoreductase [Bryobacteraceae bacterium]|nr:Gfo/Idh/MocA family oxidoreductase [Bryobacteraceae bacterium]
MRRRTFLIAGAAAAQAPTSSERVRAGVVGSGGRGTFLLEQLKELGANVAAVCDVYEPNLQRGLKAASPGALAYSDYRALLDDKSLEAIVIATPDHWHATIAIDALNAGKDVYIEKPVAHTVEEGFRVIEAVRRNKRIAQVGTQRRSSELFQTARGLMPSLGPVGLVNTWWVNYQGDLQARPLTGKLDWTQWLGSAPKREQDARRFFNWYNFPDYGGGLLVGQGAHVIDAINWFMNSSWPAAVTCSAVAPAVQGSETPESVSMTVEYPEGYLAVFTLGYRAMKYNWHNDQMQHFHGARARFDVGRESYTLWPQQSAIEMKPSVDVRKPGSFTLATTAHIRNFLECVRTRNEPNAPVEVGQHTNVALRMALQSLRTGRRVRWDAAKKTAI